MLMTNDLASIERILHLNVGSHTFINFVWNLPPPPPGQQHFNYKYVTPFSERLHT